MAAELLDPPGRAAAPRARSGEDAYPCVSEAQFERRNRRRAELPLTDLASGLPVAAVNYLQETALREFADALSLRPLERRVLELRADGVAIREIAVRLGVGKWRVERALTRIRARFRARRRAPSAGWQEVYLGETRRNGK